MDALPVPPVTGEDLARTLAEQRQRVRAFLADQRRRAHRIESELSERLRRFQDQLQRGRQVLVERQTQIGLAEAELQQKFRAVEQAEQGHEREQAELMELRNRLQQRAAELDTQQESIRSERLETENQRRRIARELHAQRQHQWKELRRRQAELEQMATTAAKEPAPTTVADSDLQRRLEMAMADLRQLRSRNTELENQLAQKPAPERAVDRAVERPAQSHPGLNWEAEKRRILAALEQVDAEDEEQVAERIRIQEVIRVTDQALREKDLELAEMRQILQEQSNNLGGLAVGASALGELLDKDSLICEERENLKRLQTQWEDTLRQAEIDISLERAKLARERLEIDEKLRAYDKLDKQVAAPEGPPDREKRSQGRWLSRLGLKDLNG